MSDQSAAGDAVPAELSVQDAMREYAKSEPIPVDESEAAPDVELASKEADAAPEKDPGEAPEGDDQEESLPPIERPRSWAKELDDEWATFPREAQERIVQREQERDKALLRSQNEAADIRKAAEAERKEAEQEKKAYQAQLPALMQALQGVSDREFPDIKSVSDYERFAMEALRLTSGEGADPFKALQINAYLKAFDAHQQKLVAVDAELKKADGDKQKAMQTELDTYKNEQDKLFHEFAPELSDPKKKAEITERAVKSLIDDTGFTMDELNKFASDPVAAKLLYHSGFQKLLYNNLKLSDLKAAPAKAVPKVVPSVQRPGTAVPKGAQDSQRIQALDRKLESSGSADDAYALFQARRRS